MQFIQTGRLLEANPGKYQLTFAGVTYRPTGSVTALGMLLFGLRPSVVYFDAEQNPVKFLDECICQAQEFQLCAGRVNGISEADRAFTAGLMEEAAGLAPDAMTAAVARKLMLENLAANWSYAVSQNS
jgi:hypothetical protein